MICGIPDGRVHYIAADLTAYKNSTDYFSRFTIVESIWEESRVPLRDASFSYFGVAH